MNGLMLNSLSKKEIYEIHLASLELLNNVGVSIRHRETQDLLASIGGRVDSSANIVQLPPQTIKKVLSQCAPVVDLHGRDGHPVMRVGGDRTFFGTAGFPVLVLDWRTGEHRKVLTQDQVEHVRLADTLENIDFIMSFLCPTDVPGEKMDLYTWKNTLMNTRKHVLSECYSKESVQKVIAMASLIAGGEDKLKERPFIAFDVALKSPLSLAPENLETIIEVAKNGLPLFFTSGPMCGATAPSTLASTLAYMNAELLAAISIVKSVNPYAPVTYGSWARIFDMKFANIATAAPEACLMRMGAAGLARLYELPSGGAGMHTDSEVPDAQAGYEKIMTGLAGALGHINMVGGVGLLEGGGHASAETLVLDNEVIGYIRRIIEGISLEDDRIDIELFKKVGVGEGKDFLSEDHTFKYYRKEMCAPDLSNRYSLNTWTENGAKSFRQRAKERIEQKLSGFVPPSLPDNFEEEADRIIES